MLTELAKWKGSVKELQAENSKLNEVLVPEKEERSKLEEENEHYLQENKNFCAELTESQYLVESLHAEIAKLSENLDLAQLDELQQYGDHMASLSKDLEIHQRKLDAFVGIISDTHLTEADNLDDNTKDLEERNELDFSVIHKVFCNIQNIDAPPGLAAKISIPSFIRRLFCHDFKDSRPKSVLVNSLSICISLLDPKRQTSRTYYMYNRQSTQGSVVSAKLETVEGMSENL
ncbi:serine/threonine-protein phosphatase 6 regulatory subunit 3-like protein, partial [Tanacetum coccineum]